MARRKRIDGGAEPDRDQNGESEMVDQVKLELLQIKHRSPDGLLHAEDAVAWAREHPGSALHQRLNWDDATAADSWRLHQMRHLIEYHVRTETGEPQLISLQVDRSNGGGYRDIAEARVDMADILLREALRELRRVRMRYGHIRKLTKIWKEIDQLQPKADDRTTSRSSSPAA